MNGATAGEVWDVEFDGGITGCRLFIHEDRSVGGLAGISADGSYYELDNPRISSAARREF